MRGLGIYTGGLRTRCRSAFCWVFSSSAFGVGPLSEGSATLHPRLSKSAVSPLNATGVRGEMGGGRWVIRGLRYAPPSAIQIRGFTA